mmetsp:Transcript_96825/g.224442  ORF Transcript_96825/g.224442 Transcript_96825/m.224442 type:complete len:287 (-) Transcript_96825:52-912(-)
MSRCWSSCNKRYVATSTPNEAAAIVSASTPSTAGTPLAADAQLFSTADHPLVAEAQLFVAPVATASFLAASRLSASAASRCERCGVSPARPRATREIVLRAVVAPHRTQEAHARSTARESQRCVQQVHLLRHRCSCWRSRRCCSSLSMALICWLSVNPHGSTSADLWADGEPCRSVHLRTWMGSAARLRQARLRGTTRYSSSLCSNLPSKEVQPVLASWVRPLASAGMPGTLTGTTGTAMAFCALALSSFAGTATAGFCREGVSPYSMQLRGSSRRTPRLAPAPAS